MQPVLTLRSRGALPSHSIREKRKNRFTLDQALVGAHSHVYVTRTIFHASIAPCVLFLSCKCGHTFISRAAKIGPASIAKRVKAHDIFAYFLFQEKKTQQCSQMGSSQRVAGSESTVGYCATFIVPVIT